MVLKTNLLLLSMFKTVYIYSAYVWMYHLEISTEI